MICSKSWLKTAAAMALGAILTLAFQGLAEKWTRRAEAATLDQLAASLIQQMPFTGGGKIRGVAGLGDGRTFVVHTDDKIFFYQFGMMPPAR